MSLADELVADFEEGGDEEEELMEQEVTERTKEEDVGEVDDIRMQADGNANSIHSLAKLRDSKQVSAKNRE